MMDMGPLHYFLGLRSVRMLQESSYLRLSMSRDLLVRFHMTDCKLEATPFLSGVHLEDGGDTPVVETPCIDSLWGSFYISPTPGGSLICSRGSFQVHAGVA
jgi:hypothetical protein